ncbi:hypothetical protein ACSAZK_03710 [Methanosarcina sp. Mfa9]|uniref:hypothetical protein n=1 Tax=Methanosarcina sp. Mfa9 TaxID=3439063 RepID=UPI003F864EFF
MPPFNKFHKILKPIALSNTRFYEKILGKYRKNKVINSGFPILFLYKGRNHEGSQKIDFSTHWLLNLQNSFFCVLKGLEKIVRNPTDTGKRTFMLQPGKTVLNLKILRPEDTQRVQGEGNGKCKGKYFPVRKKLLDEITTDSPISVTTIYDEVAARIEERSLLKKSTSIFFPAPVSSSYFQMGSIRLLNEYKFLGTNERSSIQNSVILTTVPKVWMGISGRKTSTAFEGVVPPVESAISSAKKPVIAVEKTVPSLEEAGGSIVGSSFPVLATPVIGTGVPVVKAAVPDILSELQTEVYGVKVKSVKNVPKGELLLKKMKLFNANEVFSKKISRYQEVINSTLPLLKVYPAFENHYKSDYNPAEGPIFSEVYPPLSGKNELFTSTAEDFYFFNPQKIDQELQKIKETLSGLEKSVSEKLINASFPEKASTRSAQEISIISEYVYQSIERRIRMEREMRGV